MTEKARNDVALVNDAPPDVGRSRDPSLLLLLLLLLLLAPSVLTCLFTSVSVHTCLFTPAGPAEEITQADSSSSFTFAVPYLR